MMLGQLELQFCDIQGRLFELAGREGADSVAFAKTFMESDEAACFDRPYDRTQWMGEEYLFADLDDAVGGLPRGGEVYPGEVLYWMGYLYRYWHLLTGEASTAIYAMADAETLRVAYPGFHTLDCEAAIERLKEAAGNA